MIRNNSEAYYLASTKNTQNDNPNVGSTKIEVLYDSLSLSEGQSITVGLKVRGNNSFYTGIRVNKNSNIESSFQYRWTISSNENNLLSVIGISIIKQLAPLTFQKLQFIRIQCMVVKSKYQVELQISIIQQSLCRSMRIKRTLQLVGLLVLKQIQNLNHY